jgi:hypothetical protein
MRLCDEAFSAILALPLFNPSPTRSGVDLGPFGADPQGWQASPANDLCGWLLSDITALWIWWK